MQFKNVTKWGGLNHYDHQLGHKSLGHHHHHN
jgi:hypothetical protein